MTAELEHGLTQPLPIRDRHVLCDADGNYPVGKLRDWEMRVLDTEMGRDNAVAWYRNRSSAAKDAIQVPWRDGERWRSMQPDFIFFSTKADGTLTASIVDPHGHHLADALGELRGLSDFAEKYGDRFLRIEAVTEDSRKVLRMLDLTDPGTREVVRKSQSAEEAYRNAGQRYE
jgi:type III restriction enzyme